MFATCVSNICLTLLNDGIRFDVVEDVNAKLYIPSVRWNQNAGNTNVCQNSGFIVIFILHNSFIPVYYHVQLFKKILNKT